MPLLAWVGIGIGVPLAVLLVLFLRRLVLVRGSGAIRLNLRVTTVVPGRGWSTGVGRFAGEELRWHRLFSFGVRPKRVLTRRGLAVERRRLPEGPELLSMPAGWVVLRCTSHHAPVEIAMADTTLTGFLSWLEAAPPGAVGPRPASQPTGG